jgi:signal transduction histidine kinase
MNTIGCYEQTFEPLFREDRMALIGKQVNFEVVDTGCGMSSDLQSRIFEPFVTEGKPHGTGLGMTIVKDILDAHHARIAIQSAVGQGTAIRILLP